MKIPAISALPMPLEQLWNPDTSIPTCKTSWMGHEHRHFLVVIIIHLSPSHKLPLGINLHRGRRLPEAGLWLPTVIVLCVILSSMNMVGNAKIPYVLNILGPSIKTGNIRLRMDLIRMSRQLVLLPLAMLFCRERVLMIVSKAPQNHQHGDSSHHLKIPSRF